MTPTTTTVPLGLQLIARACFPATEVDLQALRCAYALADELLSDPPPDDVPYMAVELLDKGLVGVHESHSAIAVSSLATFLSTPEGEKIGWDVVDHSPEKAAQWIIGELNNAPMEAGFLLGLCVAFRIQEAFGSGTR